MTDLEENGCPQVETTDALNEDEILNSDANIDSEIHSDQFSEEVEDNASSDVVTVTPVTEDDIPERYRSGNETGRWNGPFTARMKVSRSFVLITLKKSDTEETQSFYIPVRW